MTHRTVARTIVSVAVLVAAVAASAQPVAEARPLQAVQSKQGSGLALQGFSIALVIGELQSGTVADNVPAAARRALNDMKDFLPYKSYRLVDSAWILGMASGRWATSRLGGPGNEQYEVTVMPSKAVPSGELQLSFRLRQSETADDANLRTSRVNHEIAELRAARAGLEAQLAKLKERYGERYPEVLKAQQRLSTADQRIAALEGGAAPTSRGVTLIDTSFAMEVGETVVVGTSRVQGDKALIALLTAVPRTPAK